MDTKKIQFRPVTDDVYDELRHYWGIPSRPNRKALLGRIYNAPVYEDYIALMNDLPGHELDLELHVRHGHRWIERDPDNISESEMHMLAAYAANDRKRMRYLQVLFFTPGDRRFFSSMYFHQHRRLVVGCELSIDRAHKEHFDVQSDEDFNYYNGIWVPDHFRKDFVRGRTHTSNLASDLDLMMYFEKCNPRRPRCRLHLP